MQVGITNASVIQLITDTVNYNLVNNKTSLQIIRNGFGELQQNLICFGNNGNVGIGTTTSLTNKLNVVGTISGTRIESASIQSPSILSTNISSTTITSTNINCNTINGIPISQLGENNQQTATTQMPSDYTPENRTASHKEFLIAQRDRRT